MFSVFSISLLLQLLLEHHHLGTLLDAFEVAGEIRFGLCPVKRRLDRRLAPRLAGSPFATEVTSDRLLGLLSGVPAIYGVDARPKKLEWMIRQAKSLSGR